MPFFLRKTRGGGAKKNSKLITEEKSTKSPSGPVKKRKLSKKDIEISSDSELEDDALGDAAPPKDLTDSSDDETAQEKRFRLAKKHLAKLEQKAAAEKENAEIDHDAIGQRLRSEVLEQGGKLHRKCAELIRVPIDKDEIRFIGSHKLSPTCLTVSSSGQFAVSASKDGNITKWDLSTGKRVTVIPGCSRKLGGEKTLKRHTGDVRTLALSSDDKFLCSGGADRKIHVWNFEDMTWIREFLGHKKAVTGLSFRRDHHQLFSCSQDRSVKVWNLDEMGYVDTMFGHLDEIEGIDCLARERFITCGGRDRTVRVWKVAEESQLVFHSHTGCGAEDCLRLMNEDHFVSGADDGALSVWSTTKKKPVCVERKAHSKEVNGVETGTWITSLATLRYTDLVASGSSDGYVKLWECSEDYRSIKLIASVPLPGFINGMAFLNDGSGLVCAVGKEHRNGRWWKVPEARNGIVIIPLEKTTSVPMEP